VDDSQLDQLERVLLITPGIKWRGLQAANSPSNGHVVTCTARSDCECSVGLGVKMIGGEGTGVPIVIRPLAG